MTRVRIFPDYLPPAVNAAVDLFYRLVLADPRVSDFCNGVYMDEPRELRKHPRD